MLWLGLDGLFHVIEMNIIIEKECQEKRTWSIGGTWHLQGDRQVCAQEPTFPFDPIVLLSRFKEIDRSPTLSPLQVWKGISKRWWRSWSDLIRGSNPLWFFILVSSSFPFKVWSAQVIARSLQIPMKTIIFVDRCDRSRPFLVLLFFGTLLGLSVNCNDVIDKWWSTPTYYFYYCFCCLFLFEPTKVHCCFCCFLPFFHVPIVSAASSLTWTSAPFPTAISAAVALTGQDHCIYVFGGQNSTSVVSSSYKLNVTAGAPRGWFLSIFHSPTRTFRSHSTV